MWAEVMENRARMGGGSGLLATQTVPQGLNSCWNCPLLQKSYPDAPSSVLSPASVPLLTSSQLSQLPLPSFPAEQAQRPVSLLPSSRRGVQHWLLPMKCPRKSSKGMGWFGAKSQMERLGLAAGAVGPVEQQRARLVVSREVWRVCELLFIKGCLV